MRSHLVRGAALTLVVGAMVVAGTAAAQTPAAPTSRPRSAGAASKAARAAAHVDRGRKLYDLRRYDRAIAEFEAAYQIDADPNHLYNIAQAFRLANNIDQAIRYYQSYLEKVPGAPNRADVEGRIADLDRAKRPPNTLEPAPAAAPPASNEPAYNPLVLPGEPIYAPSTWPQAAPPPASPQPGPDAYPPAPAPSVPMDPAAVPYGYGAYPPYGPTGPLPPPGPPGPPPAPANADGSHQGLFVRLQVGPAFQQTTVSDLRYRGPGLALSVAAGSTVARQLVLFGEFGLGLLPGPDFTEGGVETDQDQRLITLTYSFGLAYYLDPSNVYFSLAAGAASLRGKRSYVSELGGGGTASVGKEWWVTDQLGIGVALQGHLSYVPYSDADSTKVRTFWVGPVLSATFN